MEMFEGLSELGWLNEIFVKQWAQCLELSEQ